MVTDKIKLMTRVTWSSKQSRGFESSMNQTQYRKQHRKSHAEGWGPVDQRQHAIGSPFKAVLGM